MSAVFITIGDGVEMGAIEENQDWPDRLILREYAGHGSAMNSGPTYKTIDMGPFTKKRIEDLQLYLERLKLHADDAIPGQ